MLRDDFAHSRAGHEEETDGSWNRTSQAQWLYGGAYGMSGTGLAGISSKIDKNKAGPYDVVIDSGH